MHAGRLNAMARKINAKRYLEVGVCEGATFFDVDVDHKVAVDPNFLFDYKSKSSKHNVFHPITSDEFFTRSQEPPFDLIFLDGLHTFEQTLRDFLASQKFAHPGTLWLLDDTVPSDVFAALPDQDRCYRLRHSLGNINWLWMGDVFKVVFFIRAAMNFYDFRTFGGHGQTAVWRTNHRFNGRQSLPLEKVGGMSFDEFVENFGMMNVEDDAAIIEAVGT